MTGAAILQALAKCAQTVRHPVGRSGVKKPDYRHRRLLRACRERPRRRRAAKQRDELTAFSFITSSASNRKVAHLEPAADIDWIEIPRRSSPLPYYVNLIKEGKLRALAVTAKKRSAALPDASIP